MAIPDIIINFSVGGAGRVKEVIGSIEKSMERANRVGVRGQKEAADQRVKVESAAAKQQERILAQQLKAEQRARDQAAKEAIRSADRVARQQEKIAQQQSKAEQKTRDQAAKAEIRAAERAGKEKLQIRNRINDLEVRAAQRSLRDQSKERSLIERNARVTGRNVGGAVSRGVGNVVGGAVKLAGLAATLGGGFAIADVMHAGIERESMAGNIVRNSSIRGNITKEDVLKKASTVAIGQGTTSEDVLGGIDAFIKNTGDLETAMSLIEDLGKMSAATGMKIEDLGQLGSQMFQQFGNAADTKKGLLAILGQGRGGAIDPRDLGSYGSRLTAQAGLFEGDKVRNVETLGGLAQIARGKGGKIDAAEATESVSSIFAELATKQKELGKMKGANGKVGIKLKGSEGKLRAVEDILSDIIVGTADKKGFADTMKLEHLLGKRAGGLAVGLASKMNEMGGVKATSVKDVIDSFRTPMTDESVEKDAADRRKELQAKINKAMEEFHEKFGSKLLPLLPGLIDRFAELIPTLATVLEKFIKLAEYLTSNLWVGIPAVISASIAAELAKGAITSAVTNGFGALFAAAKTAMGLSATADVVGTGTAAAATVGVGAGVGALAAGMALPVVGTAAILAHGYVEQGKGDDAAKAALAMGEDTAEQKKAKLATLTPLISRAKEQAESSGYGDTEGATDEFSMMRNTKMKGDEFAQGAAKSLEQLTAEADKLTAALAAMSDQAGKNPAQQAPTQPIGNRPTQ